MSQAASLFWALALVLCACRTRTAVEDAAPKTRQVSLHEPIAMEYLDPSGRFRVAESPSAVPLGQRSVLRVVTQNTSPVEVVSFRNTGPDETGQKTAFAVWMPRSRFEALAFAALAPAAGSRIQLLGGSDPQHIPPASDGVTLYSTVWCGLCQQARAYLKSNGIDYEEQDVERKSQGAQALFELASELGVVVDRVPVLVSNGRLLIGFDSVRYNNFFGTRM